MGKETIHTDNAPSAIGAYSQAVVAGEYLFTAGQIGLDPATGALVGDDVSSQTEQVLKNLSAILEAADISFNDAIKATIYLADMADFPLVNDIYKTQFSAENPPARSTVQVAGLPLGAKVEIDMVAYVGEANIPK